MLNAKMCDQIESIQKRASKIIFGWDSHYDNVIASGQMQTLHERRELLTLKFARKTSKMERFRDWFTEKDYGGLNLREKKKYKEETARTERMKKSPVFYMRQLLNEN